MSFEKLSLGRRAAPAPASAFRVVPHHPVRRALMLLLVALVVAGAAGFGFWLGLRTSGLDRDYLAALEMSEQAQEARLARIRRELTDARLAQSIDSQAARSLRDTISELRDQVAGLNEEVTFYKSLMAPSSVRRGLQIAELELAAGDEDGKFVFRLLLTQTETRRDWVQGSVEVSVQGEQTSGDGASALEVLPLTELSELEDYPLRFRFRYFQNLAGTLAFPDGFRPSSVLVVLTPKGRSNERVERSFDWLVRAE